MKEEQDVLVTHGYSITQLGTDLKVIASSEGFVQGLGIISIFIS